jgi:hypothetical protein
LATDEEKETGIGMKFGEIIRIIAFGIGVAILMFWLQAMAYERQWLVVEYDGSLLEGISLQQWLADDYRISASIVYGVCMGATVIWYIMAATTPFLLGREVERWTLLWWVLGLLPLGSIAYSVLVYNRSDTPTGISLIGFFIIDALLLFWLPTATSSPEAVKYIPPGAFLLRHKILGD